MAATRGWRSFPPAHGPAASAVPGRDDFQRDGRNVNGQFTRFQFFGVNVEEPRVTGEVQLAVVPRFQAEGVALGDNSPLAEMLLSRGIFLRQMRVTKWGYKRICHPVHFRTLLCVLTC